MEFVNEATTAKPEVNSPSYGYGFYVNGDEISHSGDGTGVNSRFVYNKNGLTTVILSNFTNGVSEIENGYKNI